MADVYLGVPPKSPHPITGRMATVPKAQPQSRLGSLLESLANTASGFVVSWLVGMFLLPMFGFAVTAGQNTIIVSVYTVVSIVRSYVWRRIFNRIHRSPS